MKYLTAISRTCLPGENSTGLVLIVLTTNKRQELVRAILLRKIYLLNIGNRTKQSYKSKSNSMLDLQFSNHSARETKDRLKKVQESYHKTVQRFLLLPANLSKGGFYVRKPIYTIS